MLHVVLALVFAVVSGVHKVKVLDPLEFMNRKLVGHTIPVQAITVSVDYANLLSVGAVPTAQETLSMEILLTHLDSVTPTESH